MHIDAPCLWHSTRANESTTLDSAVNQRDILGWTGKAISGFISSNPGIRLDLTMRSLLRHLLCTRHVSQPSAICRTSHRSVFSFTPLFQRSLWQEVPSTFAGSHLQVRPADTTVDRSCDEVRRQINQLIDCGEFTIVSFCRKIGVSRSSFYAFMRQNGAWKGEKGDTFPSALWYLQARERDGIEMPKKKKMHGKRRADVKEEIELEGESDDNVPIFNTCDEVRRKINVHMRRPDVTQASFQKTLTAQYHLNPTPIRASQFKQFRNAGGANVGNTNPVFYAAYVFFEKRCRRGKKRPGRRRQMMERIYGKVGGVNTKVPADKYGAWVGPQDRGTRVTVDEFGLAHVHTPRGIPSMYGPSGRPIPLGREDSPYFRQKNYIFQ